MVQAGDVVRCCLGGARPNCLATLFREPPAPCLPTIPMVVWCGVVWCSVVWCGVVWCSVVWCGVVWCGVVWCGVVWCGVVWCGVGWCGVGWCGVLKALLPSGNGRNGLAHGKMQAWRAVCLSKLVTWLSLRQGKFCVLGCRIWYILNQHQFHLKSAQNIDISSFIPEY